MKKERKKTFSKDNILVVRDQNGNNVNGIIHAALCVVSFYSFIFFFFVENVRL